MDGSSIFSKTGKGMLEASGKSSFLPRADRAVLAQIDGKTRVSEVNKKFEKIDAAKFLQLLQKLEKDGFVREVASSPAPAAKSAAGPPPPKPAAAPPKAAGSADSGEELDFTQALVIPPKKPAGAAVPKPPIDLAAQARAASASSAEDQGSDYRAREEANAKAAALATQRARVEAEVRAKAAAAAQAKAEADAKAKADAEAKAKTEAAAAAERASKDAEETARVEAELKAEHESERAKAESDRIAREETVRKEIAEKARQDAEEHARVEAEQKAEFEKERAKAEAERLAREEAEREAKEETARLAKEAEELARAEAERAAREESERKAKEEAARLAKEAEEHARKEAEEKARLEAEERAQADAERQTREDAERKAKEEAERLAREAEERARKEAEEQAQRAAEEKARVEAELKAKFERERVQAEAEITAREDAERKAREDADRFAAANEAASKAGKEAEATVAAAAAATVMAITPAAASATDSLLADLDSFSMRDDEERERKEAEEKARKEDEDRARLEAEAGAKREADDKTRHEEEELRREDEEARLAREAEERNAREEEDRLQEEEERKRKAKESLVRHQSGAQPAKPAKQVKPGDDFDDEIEISDADLDLDDVKADEKKLAKDKNKGKDGDKRARDQINSDARKASNAADSVISAPQTPVKIRRPVKWGKPAAIALFVLVLGGLGLLHVIPLSNTQYEQLASEALGRPVKIGSVRLSVITGVELKFEGLSIGENVHATSARAAPQIGTLFGGDKKVFTHLSIEGLVVPQSDIGTVLFGAFKGDGLTIGRITASKAKFPGKLPFPDMDLDIALGPNGAVKAVDFKSAETKLAGVLLPQGESASVEFSAGTFPLPFAPAVALSDFSSKGTLTTQEISLSAWNAKLFDGQLSGTARIRWGARWSVDGELRVKQMNVIVLAPALMSEGRADGRGTFSMGGTVPDKLGADARIEGSFAVGKGVLGSFSLARGLQTSGGQFSGRTEFSELTGTGIYNKGAVTLRDMKLAAGLLSANGTADIEPGGRISGRINAELGAQRGMFALAGTSSEPQIKK